MKPTGKQSDSKTKCMVVTLRLEKYPHLKKFLSEIRKKTYTSNNKYLIHLLQEAYEKSGELR